MKLQFLKIGIILLGEYEKKVDNRSLVWDSCMGLFTQTVTRHIERELYHTSQKTVVKHISLFEHFCAWEKLPSHSVVPYKLLIWKYSLNFWVRHPFFPRVFFFNVKLRNDHLDRSNFVICRIIFSLFIYKIYTTAFCLHKGHQGSQQNKYIIKSCLKTIKTGAKICIPKKTQTHN